VGTKSISGLVISGGAACVIPGSVGLGNMSQPFFQQDGAHIHTVNTVMVTIYEHLGHR
jgi:hypothetical protein